MEDHLHSAAYNNDTEALQAFIKAGADVNARDKEGWTLLFWAALKNSLAAAKVLVKVGADVTICANNGWSALDWAKSPEMRQLLAHAWPQDHPLRLHALLKADLTDEVTEAVAAGADVTICANDGWSAIDWADSPEMRQLLARAWPQDHPLRLHALANADLAYEVVDAVIADADVNARDEKGRTPLFCAAQKNSLAAAKVLIKTGADVNARDKQGQTPFYWAADRDNLAAADVLVKAGADVTICANDGNSALGCVGSPEMRQLLARAWPQDHPHRLRALANADLADEVTEAAAAGADVNARDEKGRTPLFWAARTNSLAAAKALAKAGADVTIRANNGQSALDRASSPEMRQLLTRARPQELAAGLYKTVARLLAENADLRAQVKEMQETIRAGAARAAPELEH